MRFDLLNNKRLAEVFIFIRQLETKDRKKAEKRPPI